MCPFYSFILFVIEFSHSSRRSTGNYILNVYTYALLLTLFSLGFMGLLRPLGEIKYPLLIFRSRAVMDMKLGRNVALDKICQYDVMKSLITMASSFFDIFRVIFD